MHIQDENDNTPEFPQRVYCVSLPERDQNKRGDPVYKVFAYDWDEGRNAELTYSIVGGNEDGKFFIDTKTAMVYSRKMVTAGAYDILTVNENFQEDNLLWLPQPNLSLTYNLLFFLLAHSFPAFCMPIIFHSPYSVDKSHGQWDPKEVVNYTATCRVDQKTFAFATALAIHVVLL